MHANKMAVGIDARDELVREMCEIVETGNLGRLDRLAMELAVGDGRFIVADPETADFDRVLSLFTMKHGIKAVVHKLTNICWKRAALHRANGVSHVAARWERRSDALRKAAKAMIG